MDGWNRVSRREPCPVCGQADNCTIREDGSMVYCGRVESGSTKQNAGGQFLHVLQSSKPSQDYEHPSHRREPEWQSKSNPKSRPNTDWPGLMAFAVDRPDIGNKRETLARKLGVSESALARLGVGWSGKHNCWLIPERDSSGNIVGIVRRYEDGSKRQMAGGRRGLTFAPDWQSDSGPILLTEGASDVAALLTIGVCAIGRPSNSGGVSHLCELLCRLPIDREVICLGENDRKSHGDLKPSVQARHSPDCEGCLTCWPGSAAFSVAEQLAEALLRPVVVAFPPHDAKDVRDMLTQTEGVS
jgi:hypothetical protein